jgi:hypothetical protein
MLRIAARSRLRHSHSKCGRTSTRRSSRCSQGAHPICERKGRVAHPHPFRLWGTPARIRPNPSATLCRRGIGPPTVCGCPVGRTVDQSMLRMRRFDHSAACVRTLEVTCMREAPLQSHVPHICSTHARACPCVRAYCGALLAACLALMGCGCRVQCAHTDVPRGAARPVPLAVGLVPPAQHIMHHIMHGRNTQRSMHAPPQPAPAAMQRWWTLLCSLSRMIHAGL